MILLLTSLALSPSQSMAVTGMQPQLRVIRERAEKRRWKVICEGRTGEEGVLHISIPLEAVEDFEATVSGVASSFGPVPVERANASTCDEVISVWAEEGGAPQSVLMVSTQEQLLATLELTKECGFTKASVRRWRPEDGPLPATGSNWFTLDAGENIVPRHGPTICFLNMVQAPLMRGNDRN